MDKQTKYIYRIISLPECMHTSRSKKKLTSGASGPMMNTFFKKHSSLNLSNYTAQEQKLAQSTVIMDLPNSSKVFIILFTSLRKIVTQSCCIVFRLILTQIQIHRTCLHVQSLRISLIKAENIEHTLKWKETNTYKNQQLVRFHVGFLGVSWCNPPEHTIIKTNGKPRDSLFQGIFSWIRPIPLHIKRIGFFRFLEETYPP